MQTLTLSTEVERLLQTEAEQTGKTATEITEEWLRQHYATLRRQRLEVQTQRFWAKHTELYSHYPDQYVAFYDDRVLDADDDMRQLALRVRATYGNWPVVIAQVTDVPVQGYQMRSPKMEPSAS